MLATDLLRLALDDERGTVLPQAGIGLDYGLAGAIVMELALRGCLGVDEERVAATGTATDDPLLDDALRVIAISSRSQPNSSARPVRMVSDCGSRICHIV